MKIMPTKILEFMEMLKIPIERVDMIWIAKMMALVELPKDWRLKDINFEESIYLFMRKTQLKYHPGILYFYELSKRCLSQEMELKVKRTILKGSYKVPKQGTYIHMNIDPHGKLVKTDLRQLFEMKRTGVEIYHPKLVKSVPGGDWLKHEAKQVKSKSSIQKLIKSNSMRQAIRKKPHDLQRLANNYGINVDFDTLSLKQKDIFSEKSSMRSAYQNYTFKKSKIDNKMIGKLEQGLFNSKMQNRGFQPQRKRFRVYRENKGSSIKLRRNKQPYFGRSAVKGVTLDYKLGTRQINLEESGFVSKIEREKKLGRSTNLVKNKHILMKENSSNNEKEEIFALKTQLNQDSDLDPFEQFELKQKIDSLDKSTIKNLGSQNRLESAQNLSKEGTINVGREETEGSEMPTALDKESLNRPGSKAIKVADLGDDELRKTLFSASTTNYFCSQVEQQVNSREFQITKYRKMPGSSVGMIPSSSRNYKGNTLSTFNKTSQLGIRKIRSELNLKRMYRENQRTNQDIKKIKSRLACRELNMSLGCLRTALSNPYQNTIDDVSKMTLPSMGEGLFSYKPEKKRKKRRAKTRK